MKIIHRISLHVDYEEQRALAGMGITVEQGFQSFLASEGDPMWNKLQRKVVEWGAVDIAITKFTSAELKNASHFKLTPTWHNGYPQPSDGFGYLAESFNLDDYCELCGIGSTQNNAIYLKKEPKWGTKKIFQLYWLYDKFFVETGTYRKVFKPMGIDYREVKKWKDKKSIGNVVQLKVKKCNCLLNLKDHKYTVCDRCARIKYLPISRGFYPQINGEEERPIFKTNEYFGSGAQAFNSIIISRPLYERIIKYKLKGIGYYPLAD